MPFTKVALVVCFVMAIDADQSQDIDSYPYYNLPISENVIDHGNVKPLRRQDGVGPGALVGVLALVSLITKSQYTTFKL